MDSRESTRVLTKVSLVSCYHESCKEVFRKLRDIANNIANNSYVFFYVAGAYYHEKFRRDDRDMCLSITRTKAPKRSRVTPTIGKDTKDANVSQKLPSFQPLKKNTRVITSNTVPSLPQPNTDISAVSISPTIFDQVSPHNNSSFLTENLSVKGPLHQAAVPSIISVDDNSLLSKPNQDSSSSDNASFPHQIKAHQQLEGSIADTCRWLINAGVPISAFDPVAIGDISHSTFSVPQVVPSTCPLNPLIPQQSTITQKAPVNACPSRETTTTVLAKNESEVLHFNTEIAATNADINSLLSAAQPSQNSDLLSAPFQDIMGVFDNESLLTDLLPGENLPVVDDSLWAL